MEDFGIKDLELVCTGEIPFKNFDETVHSTIREHLSKYKYFAAPYKVKDPSVPNVTWALYGTNKIDELFQQQNICQFLYKATIGVDAITIIRLTPKDVAIEKIKNLPKEERDGLLNELLADSLLAKL